MSTSVPPSSSVDRKRRHSVTHPERQGKPQCDRLTGKQPRQGQAPTTPLPLVRLLLVWGGLVGSVLALSIKLYQLQIVKAPELQAKARRQQQVHWRPFIPRRPVVDRERNVLALDRPIYNLYVHPKLFKLSPEEVAAELSPILNRPAEELVQLFQSRPSGIRVTPNLSETNAKQILELQISGIDVTPQYSRHYPQKDLVADVVGYVDMDRQGRAGVEYSKEKLLEYSVNPVLLRQAGDGSLLSYHVPKGFVRVDDLRLQLTIDSRLQEAAHHRLKQQLQKFNAKRGSVIVMDVRDGSILTIAAQPSYDANEYYKSDLGLFKNWVLSDLYEPGSTFKPLNVAIALETGAIKPNDVFPDPDTIKVGGWSIRNAEPEDRTSLSIAGILQHSSNVGMVQLMQKMPPADYYNWLKRLGIGKTVGIDLPFETPGQIKNQKQFVAAPIEPATASFGQGFSLTPIQLVQLHGALANGGKLVTPHVVRGLFSTQGQPHWQPVLSAPRQVFSPQTAQTVMEMMETVVTQGSGQAAQIPGYRIAGKTGTAQKAIANGRGYHSSAKITSFVGILPVESPRYVVLAVVDEPKGKSNIFGSTVAAPVVKSVMEALISLERLPPSQPLTASPQPHPSPRE